MLKLKPKLNRSEGTIDLSQHPLHFEAYVYETAATASSVPSVPARPKRKSYGLRLNEKNEALVRSRMGVRYAVKSILVTLRKDSFSAHDGDSRTASEKLGLRASTDGPHLQDVLEMSLLPPHYLSNNAMNETNTRRRRRVEDNQATGMGVRNAVKSILVTLRKGSLSNHDGDSRTASEKLGLRLDGRSALSGCVGNVASPADLFEQQCHE